MSSEPLKQRRLQILIDEPRYERLVRLARERNQSVAAVIRSFVDIVEPDVARRRRDAGQRILNWPSPDTINAQELHGERDEGISERLARAGLRADGTPR
jgi:hypothetical protein